MRLDLIQKNVGTWSSFNESCGIADGVATDFKTPIPASAARSILVMRDFEMMAPSGRLDETNQKTGEVIHTADGYKTETRGEDELWIVFQRPPSFGARVSVSGLGRQIGDAFCVLPMTTLLQKKIQEKQPKIFRAPAKERENVTQQDLQEAGRVGFEFLVVDWCGIEGGEGPLPCTPENKKAFLDQSDAMFFGLFVSNRSAAARAEQITSHSNDSKNS